MLFHPSILALLLGSLLTNGMLLYASYCGMRILRKWDLASGSELQLGLERRTYLVSTLMNYAFGFQILSFFLFIFTADHITPLLIGAMCAAGTLNANPLGYPTIILKIFNFILAGLWLIVNTTDNRAYDYPLIQKKYGLLLAITPFVVAETILQGGYFFEVKPAVITSCYGTLLSAGEKGISSGIVALPLIPVEIGFYLIIMATLALGAYSYARKRASGFFSVTSTAAFPVSIVALISFICLYFYELPTHHCPFCLLQKEYGFVGYPIYATILVAAVTGMGTGLLAFFRSILSLLTIVPAMQRKLILMSLAA
jgi:hypothetical protein